MCSICHSVSTEVLKWDNLLSHQAQTKISNTHSLMHNMGTTRENACILHSFLLYELCYAITCGLTVPTLMYYQVLS